ncbi:LysM peptidoglycan-binding domain-containing protein [Allobranchiibius sp. CTAmp26]|uniref:LysM peptidoglycan-binding domain-containing protein n=1 Tax=Allobranchiibius sp. CTAmp26 TaxID=2815214 RepID=UPI001AA14EBF|nr:LysM peptidoglycan-binding domain-containing protein [Allobranchiibius sp. CTAmp26]MBO1756469.1 LysM peptidoglycan-binding domain-containing protein [Allobranchiibius sp. CTAmp26]
MSAVRVRLAGFIAASLMLGVVVGLPIVLVAVGADPAHLSVPTVNAVETGLMSPDDGTLALSAIAVIAWAAWAVLSLSILVEITARVRGVRAVRLPGMQLPQSAAQYLVATAMLLFSVSPIAVQPALAGSASSAPMVASAATSQPGRVQARAATRETSSAAPETATALRDPSPRTSGTVQHTVRRGDTLWSIARDHLGDGRRYPEIAALNRVRLGDRPGFLQPGWVLQLPAAPTNATTAAGRTVTVRNGQTLSGIADQQLGNAARYPEVAAASRGVVQPDGVRLTDPNHIEAGWTLVIPDAAPRHDRATDPRSTAPAHDPTAKDRETSPAPPRTAPENTPSTARRDPGRALTRPRSRAQNADRANGERTSVAPWALTGLTGAGAVLAGSALLVLRRQRRAQLRARRPGRTIPVPRPAIVPVEKTITAVGSTTAATVEQIDALLRNLAAEAKAADLCMPAVAALELSTEHVAVHLSTAGALPEPWDGTPDQLRWARATTPGERIQVPESQPAPYPLLVTVGADDDGHQWLLNCEDLGAISLTGDPTYARDFARYLTAELALNPWSEEVTVDCVGIASEVAPLNSRRIRFQQSAGDVAAEAIADAAAMVDRADAHQVDTATGRGMTADDDVWGARLVLLDGATGENRREVDQLLETVEQHPGKTGTAVVVCGHRDGTTARSPIVLDFSSTGRLRVPSAGLDLVAVGLTVDEGAGCAALFAQSEVLDDVRVPCDEDASEGWRSFTDGAGALRGQYTRPRHDRKDETAGSALEGDDAAYIEAAATTAADLNALAPQVSASVREQVEDADPSLDDEVTAWLSEDCPLPRLTLLGPVRGRTHGDAVAVAKRKSYATELLAYLALRPHGVTPAQLADVFNVGDGRARNDIKMVRDWLGTNPRTGTKHLPNARESTAAKARGVNVYVVEDLLVDVDLFRRLRARGQARGRDGMDDLVRALQLVTGQPFDQLRPGGWEWLAGGDRIDHHMNAAIVDVAHLITVAGLQSGDLARARAATEIASAAVPDSEVAKLDLVAIFEAEGHHDTAQQILRDEVYNRSDDGGGPPELSDRTQTIIRNREWLNPGRAAS